jgi:hypothetical protein
VAADSAGNVVSMTATHGYQFGSAVVIDGLTVDAVSEGQPIEPGQLVRVLEVHGTRIIVRPADEQRPTGPAKSEDLLSRPIESLGLDSIDDPLA